MSSTPDELHEKENWFRVADMLVELGSSTLRKVVKKTFVERFPTVGGFCIVSLRHVLNQHMQPHNYSIPFKHPGIVNDKDIEEWDISLLACILTNKYSPVSLGEKSMRNAVDEIRKLRNDTFHVDRKLAMDNAEYGSSEKKIKKSVLKLNGEVDDFNRYWTNNAVLTRDGERSEAIKKEKEVVMKELEDHKRMVEESVAYNLEEWMKRYFPDSRSLAVTPMARQRSTTSNSVTVSSRVTGQLQKSIKGSISFLVTNQGSLGGQVEMRTQDISTDYELVIGNRRLLADKLRDSSELYHPYSNRVPLGLDKNDIGLLMEHCYIRYDHLKPGKNCKSHSLIAY